MVEVKLWSGLRRFTGGRLAVEAEGRTTGELLDALVAQYPGLGPVIEAGVSVAVDGEIHNGRRTPVAAGAEVYLMQRLKGG